MSLIYFWCNVSYVEHCDEKIEHWKDFEKKLGPWGASFTTQFSNHSGKLENEEDFSKPRSEGRATRRRDKAKNS